MKNFSAHSELHSERVMKYVHLATGTGNDLYDAGLYDEASYHFQLALEKILHSLKDQNSMAETKMQRSWQQQQQSYRPSHLIRLNVLGKPIRLVEAVNETENESSKALEFCTIGTLSSSYNEYRHSWLPSASAALLYNCAVVHFENKSYEQSKKLLSHTFAVLKSENIPISAGRGSSDFFYNDMANLSLVLSMHYLMAYAILQENRSVTPKDCVSSSMAVFKAKKHCITAMQLAEAHMKTDDVQNNLLIGPIVSLLGYCRILEQRSVVQAYDDFPGMSERAFYAAAVELYDGHRSSSEETNFHDSNQQKSHSASRSKFDMTFVGNHGALAPSA